jgi:hypothetical protein
MSTEPVPTHDCRRTARTTETAARGRTDRWAAIDETDPSPTALAPRQFDPHSLIRMRNLMDDDNAYCS